MQDQLPLGLRCEWAAVREWWEVRLRRWSRGVSDLVED